MLERGMRCRPHLRLLGRLLPRLLRGCRLRPSERAYSTRNTLLDRLLSPRLRHLLRLGRHLSCPLPYGSTLRLRLRLSLRLRLRMHLLSLRLRLRFERADAGRLRTGTEGLDGRRPDRRKRGDASLERLSRSLSGCRSLIRQGRSALLLFRLLELLLPLARAIALLIRMSTLVSHLSINGGFLSHLLLECTDMRDAEGAQEILFGGIAL